ncbi:hypothetical protein DYB32_000996, partial [Aphanomyces invadans]
RRLHDRRSPHVRHCLDSMGCLPGIGSIRMVALVAQKFVLDVAHDAKLFHEHRVNGQAGNVTSDNLTLTMEDLAASLREYGVNLSKPEYFCDSASTLQTVGTPSAVPGKAIKK